MIIKKTTSLCNRIILFFICRPRKRNTRSKAAYPPERGSNAWTREAGPAEIVYLLNYCTIVLFTFKQCSTSLRQNSAGGQGAFGDDGRHTPTPCCVPVTVERVDERPVIWRPLCENKKYLKRVFGMCFVVQGNETPSQDRGNNAITQH